MGRLAIIEDDSGASASNTNINNINTANTSNIEEKQEETTIKKLTTEVVKKPVKKQGGGHSDESGYYEGDELPASDDSIEIVYDRLVSKTNTILPPAVSITPIPGPAAPGSTVPTLTKNRLNEGRTDHLLHYEIVRESYEIRLEITLRRMALLCNLVRE